MEYRNHTSRDVLLSPHYAKHISAMTSEGLHSKAEIAEELAVRDKRIADLEAQLSALQAGEPVAEACYSGEESDYLTCLLLKPVKQGTKLYTAAPAIKQQVAVGVDESADGVYVTVRQGDTIVYSQMHRQHPVSANQPDGGKVPHGYALVPIEPTKEMLAAASNAPIPAVLIDSISGMRDLENVARYRAMLAASPSAPIAEGCKTCDALGLLPGETCGMCGAAAPSDSVEEGKL